MMHYPTLTEVEAADRLQLAKWYRFLPLPIMFWMLAKKKKDTDEFAMRDTHDRYTEIMDCIVKRFVEAGGWDVELSEQVGWEEPSN